MAKTTNNKPASTPPASTTESKAAEPAEVMDPATEALLAKLAAAEKRADDAEAALKAEAAEGAGLKVRHGEVPYAGELGGYEFKIGPADKEKYPHLPTVTQHAVDEAELKRWYTLTYEHPAGSGKRVDPISVRLLVECKDSKRGQLLKFKHRLAGIRQKLNSGAALSDSDNLLLEQNEAEILNYSTEE